jgi:Uma2 family endonuclease
MKLSDLDINQRYTYADYLKWTFDEAVELIKGRIFPMAAPLSNHQKVSGNLHRIISNFLYRKSCEVYSAPFDVRLPKPMSQRKHDEDIITVVQPDVLIVCDESKIDRRGCNGAPDWIIEILSKGTEDKDVKDKFEVYEESGVREYWIASVEDRTILVYRLQADGIYKADRRPYAKADTIVVGVLEGFSLQVDDIFEGLRDFQ